MRKLLLILFLGSSIHIGNVNAAGIPVIDAVMNAREATRDIVYYSTVLQRWYDQIHFMEEQYNKLLETHESMTGVRNIGDVFDDPTLNQYLPEDWNTLYRALKSGGYGALVDESLVIYNRNKVYETCDVYEVEDMKLDCQSTATRAAINAADADKIYASISSRTEQINELQTGINLTEDPKAIAELQARLLVEQADIANEQIRLDALRLVQESDEQLAAQRKREFLARSVSGTTGVVLEPLEF